MRRIPGEFLSFFLKVVTEWCKAEQLMLTPVWKQLNCFLSHCLWLTVFTHFRSFHRQVSPGHNRSLRPALPSQRIPPDDCGGPGVPWPRASGVYIFSNLPEKKNSSQLQGWTSGKPITATISGMFVLSNTFFLGCFFFSNLCYLSQNKIRTKLMSALNLYAGLFRWGTPSFSAGNLSGDE